MSASKQPNFLVSAHSEPVAVQVHGKANYLNCNHFREFMESMLSAGKNRIHIDFAHCRGMDSTFLGILAGSALELHQHTPPGRLSISHLDEHNRQLITNLGLQALLHIEEEPSTRNHDSGLTGLENREVDDAAEVLQAHQNLVQADAANAAKFEDVISFLKNQVQEQADP
ncbi:MAG: STAS domain-containing protein [Coraliomargarita sp.]